MSTKIKKQQENDAKLVKATTTLQQIADSNITPRNIRKIVKDSILMLQDPNMPSFARVTLWSAVSELESIREQ